MPFCPIGWSVTAATPNIERSPARPVLQRLIWKSTSDIAKKRSVSSNFKTPNADLCVAVMFSQFATLIGQNEKRLQGLSESEHARALCTIKLDDSVDGSVR